MTFLTVFFNKSWNSFLYCSPLLYLTSGAGSKAWRGDVEESDSDVKFFYDGQGFMSVQMTETEAKFSFFNWMKRIKKIANKKYHKQPDKNVGN